MPHFMLQLAYTADNWAAQLKNPQDRIEHVAKVVVERAGCELEGAWYCFGEYDMMLVVKAPDAQTVASITMAVAAGGSLRAGQTTPLMTGPEAVEAMRKAAKVSGVYKPAQ